MKIEIEVTDEHWACFQEVIGLLSDEAAEADEGDGRPLCRVTRLAIEKVYQSSSLQMSLADIWIVFAACVAAANNDLGQE